MKQLFEAAVVTHPSFEDIAATEVEELIGVKATAAATGIVSFQAKQLIDLCKLCYLSQSATAVLSILSQFSVANTAAVTAANLKKSLQKIDFSMWFSKETTFKVDFEAPAARLDFPTSELK